MHIQKDTSYKIGLKISRCSKEHIYLNRECNITQYATPGQLRGFWSTVSVL